MQGLGWGWGKQSLLKLVVGRAAELQDGEQQELLAQSCSLQEEVCGSLRRRSVGLALGP